MPAERKAGRRVVDQIMRQKTYHPLLHQRLPKLSSTIDHRFSLRTKASLIYPIFAALLTQKIPP
jgi:hypothetical protein